MVLLKVCSVPTDVLLSEKRAKYQYQISSKNRKDAEKINVCIWSLDQRVTGMIT